MKYKQIQELLGKNLPGREAMFVVECREMRIISPSRMKILGEIADRYGVKWRPSFVERLIWRIKVEWWFRWSDYWPPERKRRQQFKNILTTTYSKKKK